MRHTFWIKAVALLGLLLIGLLVHHVAEGHHGEDHVDCPICYLAASIFLLASVFSINIYLRCLGIIGIPTGGRLFTAVIARRGRGPPLSAIL